MSRTTATPTLLLLHIPWAVPPYRTGQFLWLVGQWMMLLGTAGLWMWAAKASQTNWMVALVVVAFSFTSAWRLHAERGQSYVLLLFLFACWLTATLDTKRSNGFLTGCLAGFLVAVRPPFLLLVPFLVWHRRGQLTGAATGFALGVVLPMFMLFACWSDYFSATQIFSYYYRHGIHPSPVPQNYPSIIEGIPLSVINHSLYLPAGIFSVHGYLLRFGLEPIPAWPPIFLLGMAFVVWFWFSRAQPAASLLPGLAAWLFLADLCLPVYRESYDDVLILNVIAAGLAVTPRFPWQAWPCCLSIPMGAAVYVRNLDHPWVIMPSALFTLSAILFLWPLRKDARPQKNGITD